MEKNYVAGVDMGGTNTVIGIVDRQGTIASVTRIGTTDYDTPGAFADALVTELRKMAETIGISGQIAGIGVGAPCANYMTGEIEAATDLPWPSPIPIARLISERSSLPVKISNDANAAAVGEMTYGAARGISDFIMITLGTGVGSGIVCDGRVLSGSHGFAGELGHVMVRPGTRDCGCGRKGCLQTFCSAKGVVATAIEKLSDSTRPSSLRDIPHEKLTSKDIGEAAADGDELAIETMRFTGEVLGEACANFVAMSDPRAVVLFGGVTKAGRLLVDPMTEAMERNMLHLYKGKVRVLLSQLKESEAALLGASALGWEAGEEK